MAELVSPKIKFDRKFLIKLVIPLIIEQILAVMVGMADMIMVRDAGETAVSGISLVNTIANLIIYVFAALATGGAVVASQSLGAKKKDTALTVSNQLILICFVTGLVFAIASAIFDRQILMLIYGNAEEAVMDAAVVYFFINAFSFPFLAVYNGSTALFRSMGNSKLSMYVSTVMNLLNIIGNTIFVYGFKMGVEGVAYSTVISRALACVYLFFVLRDQKLELHIDKYCRLGFDFGIIKSILRIGIPSGVDNAMFQIGKLFTQALITSFGTASLSANACATTIELLATIPASATGLAITTVVGQCVGAGDYNAAKFYGKKLLKSAYLMLWLENIVILFIAPQIAWLYGLSAEGTWLATLLIRLHSICAMVMWPCAWSMNAMFRASGDVKYLMVSSMVIMWVFRIGLAYVIGGWLMSKWGIDIGTIKNAAGEVINSAGKVIGVTGAKNFDVGQTVTVTMGVVGVWIAMFIDWFARCVNNLWRLHSGRWMKKAVV